MLGLSGQEEVSMSEIGKGRSGTFGLRGKLMMMKVKFLSIKSAPKLDCQYVLLSIGGERQVFEFTTEINRVGDRLLQTTRALESLYVKANNLE